MICHAIAAPAGSEDAAPRAPSAHALRHRLLRGRSQTSTLPRWRRSRVWARRQSRSSMRRLRPTCSLGGLRWRSSSPTPLGTQPCAVGSSRRGGRTSPTTTYVQFAQASGTFAYGARSCLSPPFTAAEYWCAGQLYRAGRCSRLPVAIQNPRSLPGGSILRWPRLCQVARFLARCSLGSASFSFSCGRP